LFVFHAVLLRPLFGLQKAFHKYHKAKQVTGGEQGLIEVGCKILPGDMHAGKAKRYDHDKTGRRESKPVRQCCSDRPAATAAVEYCHCEHNQCY
jgi:hypothetical protein